MEGHHLHEAPRKGEEEKKMKKREERRMESTYFSKKLSCSMKGSQGSSTQAYKKNHMTHKVLIKSQLCQLMPQVIHYVLKQHKMQQKTS